jgi:hypothetical protein
MVTRDAGGFMSKYRKKPAVIDAMMWSGKASDLKAFTWWAARADVEARKRNGEKLDREATLPISYIDGFLDIATLEGTMRANPGDFVICGVKGEFYPCKPDIFAATYDAVE